MIVLDTHVLLWWLSGSPRLSRRAGDAIRKTLQGGPAVVSAFSVFEIVTAVRRGRYQLTKPLEEWLSDVRLLPEIQFEPVSFEVARHAGELAAGFPGDPADRIIAATAMLLRARLVTADRKLAAVPGLQTVW